MSDGFAPRAAHARTGPHCPKKDESRYIAWRARIALNGLRRSCCGAGPGVDQPQVTPASSGPCRRYGGTPAIDTPLCQRGPPC